VAGGVADEYEGEGVGVQDRLKEWPFDSARGKRVTSGEQDGIPQGLKPASIQGSMSELKLRPPKEQTQASGE
jgi:hypothetical protein